MTNPEQVERMRQAVMRFRELLDIMQLRLADSERAYTQLFARYTADELAGKPEKDRQGMLARDIVDTPLVLGKPVMQARFDARELEREFEYLHDIIMSDVTE
jgi:hypothetical protein